MILGIGVDTVAIERFAAKLEQTPALVARLFREEERDASAQTLAGRFAAKEAVIKALAGAGGIEWHGILVGKRESGQPFIELSGATAEIAAQLGIVRWQVSISHDGPSAVAFVIAEGGCRCVS